MKTARLHIFCLLVALTLPGPATAAKYKESDVSGGGAITGKIVYHGPVKTRTVLPTKDKAVCGGPRKQALVEEGSGGAVKNAVAFLKGVKSGKAWPKLEQKPAINNIKCRLEPHVQVARRGKVDIVNSDPVLHNTHGYYGKRTAFNVAMPLQDARVSKLLRTPGVVRVDCDAHGWMLGWIYVVDNPYYALTGDDGTFSIADMPPGDYTLVVWQEQLGITEVPVSVKAAGALGLFETLTTMRVAHAASESFSFAWVSDTHLYPRSLNTRFEVFASAAVDFGSGILLRSTSSVPGLA